MTTAGTTSSRVSLPVFFDAGRRRTFSSSCVLDDPTRPRASPTSPCAMEFLGAHPESVPAVQYSMARSRRLATQRLNITASIRSCWSTRDGRRTPFRYQWEPHAGTAGLTDAEAAERPCDYLHAELSDRLAREPVHSV